MQIKNTTIITAATRDSFKIDYPSQGGFAVTALDAPMGSFNRILYKDVPEFTIGYSDTPQMIISASEIPIIQKLNEEVIEILNGLGIPVKNQRGYLLTVAEIEREIEKVLWVEIDKEEC